MSSAHTPDAPPPAENAVRESPRLKNTVLLVMAVIILIPSMLGFFAKFYEFAHTLGSDSGGAFAITPMLNYLLASAGFFCLLVWAIANGMFFDMESPKYHMLQLDQQLDRQQPKEK
jgi:hypothetical protein